MARPTYTNGGYPGQGSGGANQYGARARSKCMTEPSIRFGKLALTNSWSVMGDSPALLDPERA